MSRHPPFKEVEASRPEWNRSSKMEFIQPPKPDWAPGGGPNGIALVGNGESYEVDPATRPTADIYRMIISAVTPRPVAFISTVNTQGAINVAPFSFFNLASSNPPTVMISISHVNPPARKETCINILETKEFCVNIISENFIEASNFASVDCPPGVSEWVLAGLTPVPNQRIKAPRVGESAFSMECELVHHYDILTDSGVLASTVILGRVRLFHVREDIVNKETLLIDTAQLAPIARLGGISYGTMTGMYELERPSWSKWGQTKEIQQLLEKAKEG